MNARIAFFDVKPGKSEEAIRPSKCVPWPQVVY
jgi:hypothetical protein